MKIEIETGGDKVFCGEDCPFVYGSSNRSSYECENFRNTSGEWRKLRTKEGHPKRCKPCVESLVKKMKHIKTCCGQTPVVEMCTYTPVIDGPSHDRYFCKCLECGREIASGNSWQNNKAEKIGYLSRESAIEAWDMFIGFMDRK